MKFVFLKEEDKGLNKLFKDINILKVDVAYPLLLKLYDDYEQNYLSYDDLIEILTYIESYVFRRAICDIPTNSLNKTFATIGREIDRDNYLDSLEKALLFKDSYRRSPKNEEFHSKFVLKDAYNFRNRNYLLGKLENYDRKEEVCLNNYTVEHIMPQNEKLSPEWIYDIGDNWEEIQSTYLHTIGNLTLTGYNSELRDRTFIEKRNMEGGFSDSPLRLNRTLAKIEHWNEEEILKRANNLADLAVNIWPSPDFTEQLPDINIKEIISNVFPTEKDFIEAQSLMRQIIEVVDYDKIKHILGFTYRNKKRITVNLGQWLILSFKRYRNSLKVSFCIDFNLLDKNEFNIDESRLWSFSDRWTKGKNFKIISFSSGQKEIFSESLIKAWYAAILHSYTIFHTWSSSSFMKYSHPELVSALLGDTSCAGQDI